VVFVTESNGTTEGRARRENQVSMENDCETFEVELGMREHGALDPARMASLDAHLAGCPACRTYAESSGTHTTSLKREAELEADHVDWEHLQRGVHRLRRSYRLKLWLAPAFLFLFPLALLVSGGHVDPKLYVLAPISNFAIYVAYLWLVGRPFREVLAVAKSNEPLLDGYVRELRRTRLRTWLFVAWNGAAALAMLTAALLDPRMRLYGTLCALGFGAWTAYDLKARLPRLRRALAEVGR
jgi:predicted anti-sigma-YlaC factor YlaD